VSWYDPIWKLGFGFEFGSFGVDEFEAGWWLFARLVVRPVCGFGFACLCGLIWWWWLCVVFITVWVWLRFSVGLYCLVWTVWDRVCVLRFGFVLLVIYVLERFGILWLMDLRWFVKMKICGCWFAVTILDCVFLDFCVGFLCVFFCIIVASCVWDFHVLAGFFDWWFLSLDSDPSIFKGKNFFKKGNKV